MIKYNFFNDYSEGAHSSILEMLLATNLQQENGYGEDSFCLEAKELLKKAVGNAEADVHFVSGGTQANLIVLLASLKSYESVIAASTAHINVHEAGAIEATGHKICAVDGVDGKLTVDLIQKVLDKHYDEHLVKPRVVFISNPTELGTLYKKAELKKIAGFCKEKGLYLYLDGARLGMALCSKECDYTLQEMSAFLDAFYIGGTKNGALLGEAIVINNPELKKDFRYHLKQRGALLAKGRLLGVQFLALFRDGLYFELAKHADEMAARLAEGIAAIGFKFMSPAATNQLFPIMPNVVIAELQKLYGFYVWTKIDGENSGIRLVTSWATKVEMVEALLEDLGRVANETK